MEPNIKKEAYRVEACTAAAQNTCFDLCVDYFNPSTRMGNSWKRFQHVVMSLPTIWESDPVPNDAEDNSLTEGEARCMERCSVKYFQAHRILENITQNTNSKSPLPPSTML